jgi:hypothetical protein
MASRYLRQSALDRDAAAKEDLENLGIRSFERAREYLMLLPLRYVVRLRQLLEYRDGFLEGSPRFERASRADS